jgi:hypothetical protein
MPCPGGPAGTLRPRQSRSEIGIIDINGRLADLPSPTSPASWGGRPASCPAGRHFPPATIPIAHAVETAAGSRLSTPCLVRQPPVDALRVPDEMPTARNSHIASCWRAPHPATSCLGAFRTPACTPATVGGAPPARPSDYAAQNPQATSAGRCSRCPDPPGGKAIGATEHDLQRAGLGRVRCRFPDGQYRLECESAWAQAGGARMSRTCRDPAGERI